MQKSPTSFITIIRPMGQCHNTLWFALCRLFLPQKGQLGAFLCTLEPRVRDGNGATETAHWERHFLRQGAGTEGRVSRILKTK